MAKGLSVRLVTTGIKKTLRRLEAVSDRAKDLRPVWPRVADDWARMNAVTFNRDGASPGWGRWQPINPVYAAQKASEGFLSAILRRTGALHRSLTNRGDTNFLYRPQKQQLTLGTSMDYASFHQEGRGVPQREPIRQDSGATERWSRLIRRYVVDGEV